MSRVIAQLAISAGTALAGPKPVVEPVAWGMTSGNTACVIFEEENQYTGLIGIAGKTPVLRVAGTLDYALVPREWLETQQNMDAVKALAEKDHVKLIKIPEEHSRELMRSARACAGPGCKARNWN
jgi:hypothetical protein